MNYTHLWQWSLVVIIIVGLIYAMIVIKNEKFDYIKRAIANDFHGYTLLLPSWWSKLDCDNENKIQFHRADTYYDWKATFLFLNDSNSNEKTIEILFRDLIEKQEIKFDENEAIIHEPSEFKHIPAVKNGDYDIVRVEGMGTEKAEHRIYLDAFLLRDNKRKVHLYGQSYSSVLNGMLEGPYFEEVLKHLVKNLT